MYAKRRTLRRFSLRYGHMRGRKNGTKERRKNHGWPSSSCFIRAREDGNCGTCTWTNHRRRKAEREQQDSRAFETEKTEGEGKNEGYRQAERRASRLSEQQTKTLIELSEARALETRWTSLDRRRPKVTTEWLFIRTKMYVYTTHVASQLLKNGRPRLITLKIFMYRHASRRPPSCNKTRFHLFRFFFSIRAEEQVWSLRATVNARARAIEEIATTISTHLPPPFARYSLQRSRRIRFPNQTVRFPRGSSFSTTFRRPDVEFLQTGTSTFRIASACTLETHARSSIHVISTSQHRRPFHKLDAR